MVLLVLDLTSGSSNAVHATEAHEVFASDDHWISGRLRLPVPLTA